MEITNIDVIDWLGNMISEFDKVYLVFDKNLYKLLAAEKNGENKILFLLPFEDFTGCISEQEHRCISWEDCCKLCELYFMYEFSDRFQILYRKECFGSLMNFIDTGLLTYKEITDALLY